MGRRQDVGRMRHSVQTEEGLIVASGSTEGMGRKKWCQIGQDAAPAYQTPD